MKESDPRGSTLLDVRLLRLFEALYATRSVSRAAEQLGQAQPTVSIWLSRLRHELQDPLFVRTPAGMEPTPRAEALIDVARSAIDILQRLTAREVTYDPGTDKRCFRICMTDASHVTLLPRLLSHIRADAPHARVEALQIGPSTGAHLQSGEADLALGLIPALEAGFYQQTLYSQDWVCLANPCHPRLRRRLSRADYDREAHVGIASGTGYQILHAALAKAGMQRRMVLELPGFLGLGAILSSTDLIATLPRHTGETLAAANGLAFYPCPIAIPSLPSSSTGTPVTTTTPRADGSGGSASPCSSNPPRAEPVQHLKPCRPMTDRPQQPQRRVPDIANTPECEKHHPSGRRAMAGLAGSGLLPWMSVHAQTVAALRVKGWLAPAS